MSSTDRSILDFARWVITVRGFSLVSTFVHIDIDFMKRVRLRLLYLRVLLPAKFDLSCFFTSSEGSSIQHFSVTTDSLTPLEPRSRFGDKLLEI